MSLVRTNLVNWKVTLPAKPSNWLRLVDEGEYDVERLERHTNATTEPPRETHAAPVSSPPQYPRTALKVPVNLLRTAAVH